jgi:uncharacterized protein YabE (DUF348 family)
LTVGEIVLYNHSKKKEAFLILIKNMKNLFSQSFKQKKWWIIISSIVVLLTLAGFGTYEGTKKHVTVTLDGHEKMIKTHASTVEELLYELDISLKPQDDVAPAKDSKVTNDIHVVWKPAKQVQFTQNSGETSVWTTTDTVEDFLKEQQVVLNKYDVVKPERDTALQKGMNVIVEKAFPLTLADGGEEKQVWSTSTTVADFLNQQGILLTEFDRVEPGLDKIVLENGKVNVTRVEKVTDVVEEPISFAVVTQKDENLPQGTEKVITPGAEGAVLRTYEIIKKNGKEVQRAVLSEKTIKEKQDKVVAVGTKVDTYALASRGSDDGREIHVTATAYTANCNGCSGTTATGINLHANPNAKVIAVDPNVIPLGSKVHVEGYGYAVAADTGGAIKGSKIDLFMPSKQDARNWGRKTVKIKILD